VKYGGRPRPDAYWIGKQTMVDFLNGIGARIVAVRQTREKVYIDCSYLVTKD
jgi:hypothetical protein